LISVLVIAGGMLLFAKLVDEVVEGETHAFDQAVLLAFRNPGDLSDPIGPAWLQIMFRDITCLGGPTVVTLITVAVIGFLLIDGKRFAALLMLASVGGGLA
jgi:undecaprenyl-diphosphatase